MIAKKKLKKKIIIIDYGMGNILSIQNAINFLGYKSLLSNEPKIIEKKETVVEDTTTESITTEEKAGSNIIIKSPMIGTFYRSPNPESDPFVSEGETIKPGQTICIIEAMKLFNEIESEVTGKVVKVLANDSSPVEFDQPLFEIDPS